VFDDQTPAWWYEDGGRQAGPVTTAALQRLLAEGRVSPAHRVWKNGMAGWEPMSRVAELAPVLGSSAPAPAPHALPPPIAPPPRSWAPSAGEPGAVAAQDAFEEIPVGLTVFLAVITFGIYGLVKFFQTARSYEELAGRSTRFGTYFWLFVGLGVAGIVLNGATGIVGVPLGIASAVFQVLTLGEALQARDEGMRRRAISVPVTSAQTHRLLLILAIVLSPILVGLVLAVVQAVKWFRDWNAIVPAARGRA
jgi:hypothetical protein